MTTESTMSELMASDGIAGSPDEWRAQVEKVAETLDIGPGTAVWDAGCGAGAFLYPFWENAYLVGGTESRADRVALARSAMPGGRFVMGEVWELDPAEPWAVVVASRGFGDCSTLDHARGLLARMVAKATHAVAILGVDEGGPGLGEIQILRMLAELGVVAVQFEAGRAGVNVFARV